MRPSVRRILGIVGSVVFAVVLTLSVGGLWTLLVSVNLAATPAIPWAVVAMAAILWLLWRYMGGAGWPRRTARARHRARRANPVAPPIFAWALVAGGLAIVALSGLWIVLSRLVKTPGNRLPDFAAYPPLTVVLVLGMASLVAAVSEEVGIRGYVQGTLERALRPPVAIVVAALAIAPGHGLTQGFAWPILLFYLLVDVTFGASAHFTGSILPGIVVHGVGILIFFSLIWPRDASRVSVREGGTDGWFWLHAAQAVIFAALAILAFVRLARITEAARADRVGARRAAQ